MTWTQSTINPNLWQMGHPHARVHVDLDIVLQGNLYIVRADFGETPIGKYGSLDEAKREAHAYCWVWLNDAKGAVSEQIQKDKAGVA